MERVSKQNWLNKRLSSLQTVSHTRGEHTLGKSYAATHAHTHAQPSKPCNSKTMGALTMGALRYTQAIVTHNMLASTQCSVTTSRIYSYSPAKESAATYGRIAIRRLV